MSNKQVAFIGGSGIYKLDGVKIIEEYNIETPFGKPSSAIIEAEFEEHRSYFLTRHGVGHRITPSDINYRANIYALKTLGVEYIVSISAVGSLKEELPPASFFLPDQFIDWTKGKRARSFFGEDFVGHVSVANPIEVKLQEVIFNACKEANIPVNKDGSYICIEGPQFSTRAESALYRSFGASVIGMTNVPEAFLAKEAGIAYATMAMVTDYDAWKDEHCTLEEILKVVKTNTASAQRVMKVLIPMLANNKFDFQQENGFAVMTAPELMNDKDKQILEVLTR